MCKNTCKTPSARSLHFQICREVVYNTALNTGCTHVLSINGCGRTVPWYSINFSTTVLYASSMNNDGG
jgi:hypothetical protein